jgi:hypothetical protein
MGQADWYRHSDLVRHDDRSLRGLVASQVKQASQLADTSPSSKLRKRPAPRSYSGSLPGSNPHPDPPRSVGFRSPRTRHYEPGSNPDALFDVPIAGQALDR